jgi:predicted porin
LGSGNTISGGANYVMGPVALGAAYLRMQNTYGSGNTWLASSDGNFNSSPVAGFIGARSIQILDAVAQYTIGGLTVGTNYGYTQFRPSTTSSFTKVQAYNSMGLGAKYYITPFFRLGGSISYTIGQALAANAPRPQYEGVAMNGLYSLSKRTTIYGIVGYQHAKGSTVDASGNIVAATSSIGDSANGSSSGTGNQFLVRAGLAVKF